MNKDPGAAGKGANAQKLTPRTAEMNASPGAPEDNSSEIELHLLLDRSASMSGAMTDVQRLLLLLSGKTEKLKDDDLTEEEKLERKKEDGGSLLREWRAEVEKSGGMVRCILIWWVL